MQGKIIKQVSNDYTVLANNQKYICKSRGKFRNMNIIPLVGDLVEFNEKDNYILKIYPRKNELVRPNVSNIDQVMVITSVKRPDFSSNLLDKLLVVIEFHNIEPIIIFTKLDLLSDEEKEKINEIKKYYESIGYKCFMNTELDEIKTLFKDKVTVFTGQSGAGKSTLFNNLNINLNLETNEISDALGRGKHTTRHTELLFIEGGMVADTPGFSSLSLSMMSGMDIRDNFKDFNMYRDLCKYRDCMHDKEDHCIIKDKVNSKDILESRYENYIKFIHEEHK